MTRKVVSKVKALQNFTLVKNDNNLNFTRHRQIGKSKEKGESSKFQ